MCTFSKEIRNKTQFTGYKMACKKNGKYYSPCMGIKYKPGLVEVPEVQKKIFFTFFNTLLLNGQTEYKGMTAIFETEEGCKETMEMFLREGIEKGYEPVILKMTIQKTKNKNCWQGHYFGKKVYIGPKIRSMKEIKS